VKSMVSVEVSVVGEGVRVGGAGVVAAGVGVAGVGVMRSPKSTIDIGSTVITSRSFCRTISVRAASVAALVSKIALFIAMLLAITITPFTPAGARQT
jgi:hypothetical protein